MFCEIISFVGASFLPVDLKLPLSDVGEALLHSASGDFERTSLLMANHMDDLCELVRYSSLFSTEAHIVQEGPEGIDDEEGPSSTEYAPLPKIEVESSPVYSSKQKR